MNIDTILSAVPRYKNFGGPNHGGDYVKIPFGQPGYNPTWGEYTWVRHNGAPLDGQDALYEAHDQGYSKAEIKLANGEITAEQAQYEKMQADVKLVKDLITYNPLFDPQVSAIDAIAAVTYKESAMALFTIIAAGRASLLVPGMFSNEVGNLLQKLLNLSNQISTVCPAHFDAAQQWYNSSPIVFDLDGDGIETVGMVRQYAATPFAAFVLPAESPILFDHNGDGVKTNTGWIKSDDGMLVMDRNGNGTIDSGKELFGDSTSLYAGSNAADGFAALAQEDTNADGVLNNLDANWANLKVWRDLNSDGISQTEELFTLEELGITGVNTAKTNTTQTLADGNEIIGTGTFTKTDGTVGNLADVWFNGDTFTREFSDEITISQDVMNLPEIKGSGLVRDLHQAAMLSPVLKSLLSQYNQATTWQQQNALFDQLFYAWADTSGLVGTMDERDPDNFRIRYNGFGNVLRTNSYVDGVSGPRSEDPYTGLQDIDNPLLTDSYHALISEWNYKLHILESFNGRYFFAFPQQEKMGVEFAIRGIQCIPSFNGIDPDTLAIQFIQPQLDLLNEAYNDLRKSVYESLLYQTRFETVFIPLLDKIELNIGTNGQIVWDYGRLKQHFNDAIAANAATGMADLLEFNRYVGNVFLPEDWQGNILLAEKYRTTLLTPELQNVYSHFMIFQGHASSINGTDKDDIIVSRGLEERTIGGAIVIPPVGALGGKAYGMGGNDVLIGGYANDELYGGNDDDTLDGGLGNDALSGDAGGDILIGGLGNDILHGGADNDNLYGREGDDNLNGGYGNDVMLGDAGDDVLKGDNGDDILDGGEGNDTLDGNRGNDIYRFGIGSGVDTISNDNAIPYYPDFWSTTDAVEFGEGITLADLEFMISPTSPDDLQINITGTSDVLIVKNWLTGGEWWRFDEFRFSDGTILTAADVNVFGYKFHGTMDDDTLNGSSYNDIIYGYEGADSLNGDTGSDTLLGGLGNDTLRGMNGADSLDGGEGNDSLNGGYGNDIMFGGAGDDVLTGDDGDDILDGGAANDTLDGNRGNDIYRFSIGSGIDTISNNNQIAYPDYTTTTDAVEFGDGITLADLEFRVSSISINDLQINVIGTSDTLIVKNWLTGSDWWRFDEFRFSDGTILTPAQVDAFGYSLYGTSGNDALNGSVFNDVISGYDGNDTISGGSGNDTIDGSTGIDSMLGGAGNDTYYLDSASDIVTESSNAGTDTVQIALTHTLSSNVENLILTGTDAINGTGNSINNLIIGNSVNNILTGYAGNDTLDGGAGADTLIGGAGNDTYVPGNTGDVITENANEGTDTVQSSIDYTLGNNLENLILTGSSAINGTGNTLDNIVTGNSAANILAGNAGNDTLDGGTGADTLMGGTGNDIYAVDNIGDVVTENADEGTDTVQSSIDYTLGANVENLTLKSNNNNGCSNVNIVPVITGDGHGVSSSSYYPGEYAWYAFDGICGAGNTWSGNGSGASWLKVDLETASGVFGEKGSITSYKVSVRSSGYASYNMNTWHLYGSNDDFTYVELDSQTGLSWTLGEEKTFTLGGATNYYRYFKIEGTSPSCNPAISELKLLGKVCSDPQINGTGNTLDNIIVGNSAANVLTGNAGNDTLDGGSGADTLIGGTGNDIYVIDSSADVITENSEEGSDTVQSSIDYTLGTNVENLILKSNNNNGGSNANILPVITGDGHGVSSSSYYPGEYAWYAFDGICGGSNTWSGYGSGLSWLKVDLETASGVVGKKGSLTSYKISVRNSGYASYNMNTWKLYGSNDDSTYVELDSRTGLSWALGEEKTFVFGSATDYYRYFKIEGTSPSGNPAISELKLFGNVCSDSQINGTGNALDNILTGNSASNILTGLDGNDILDGGAGADTLVGGLGNDGLLGSTGSDTYLFRRTDGIDTLNDYSTNTVDADTLQLTDGITSSEPVIVKQNGDLYIFVDTGNYVKIASQFTATTYGIERLEVSDGHYITRSDIETIVDTMSTINNNTGMDVMQKYNAMMADSTYIATLANTWRAM